VCRKIATALGDSDSKTSGTGVTNPPSPPPIPTLRTLRKHISELRVIFVLIGMMYTHMPITLTLAQSQLSKHSAARTSVSYPASGTYAPDRDKTGKHNLVIGAQGRAVSSHSCV
jgi:hypothetical protein